jgi:hypothetical protein
MGLFGNKFNKLKREDVVTAIVDLEGRETDIEKRMDEFKANVDAYTAKAKAETDRTRKVFLVKKINNLRAENENNVQRAMMLMYNIQLLNKLKDAIDDKNFVANVGNVPLNKLLGNQKELAQFLNKALNNKIKMEDIMTNADETFAEVAMGYEPNKAIYGVSNADDALLASFEAESALVDETEINEAGKIKKEGIKDGE